MSFRSSFLVPFFFLAACSSSSSSPNGTVSSTSTVAPKTIAGICNKLNELSCAEPNCVDKFDLIQSNCKSQADDVQSLIDCLSVASFTCGGNPSIPRTNECADNVNRVSLCASGVSDGNPPVHDGGASGTCASATDCTAWPCQCADGSIVSIASCTNAVCDDVISVCASNSESHVSACKSHGGVN